MRRKSTDHFPELHGDRMGIQAAQDGGRWGLIASLARKNRSETILDEFNIELKAGPVTLPVDAIAMKVRQGAWFSQAIDKGIDRCVRWRWFQVFRKRSIWSSRGKFTSIKVSAVCSSSESNDGTDFSISQRRRRAGIP